MPVQVIFHAHVLLLLTALTFCSADTQQPSTQIDTFYLRTNPVNGPPRLSEGWIDTSPISCAVMCLKSFTDCSSFMYNAETGLCTPGSRVDTEEPPPSQTEGNLYTIICDSSLGFNVYTYESTIACVGVFEPALNYSNADAACRKKQAFLVSVKTKEKLVMLKQIWNSRNIWVGCDALQERGVYRWREDNSELTNDTINEVFLAGQLNTGKNTQICANMPARGDKLAVFYCSSPFSYACEITIP